MREQRKEEWGRTLQALRSFIRRCPSLSISRHVTQEGDFTVSISTLAANSIATNASICNTNLKAKEL
jgi:hypothetical protein